jgi:aldehyde:ferredoxin oxidoreductase
MSNTDIYINPASQEIYADFYNGMLGTDMTWQAIFDRTDRDINLQRVMNVLVYGSDTGKQDWIPDRAIGPTDDILYDAEREYHDGEVAKILGKPLADIHNMKTEEKRGVLMENRKRQLTELIRTYYEERGWSASGIPTPETLKKIGLWDFLTTEARERMAAPKV